MTSALVGYTGFVGGNIQAAHSFDELYNSTNIRDIEGREFDLLVFSAARAEKWRINQDPESDLRHIEDLERTLANVSAERIVLISTVDVYPRPRDVDETSPIDLTQLHPYGLHRLRLEEFVSATFARAHVVRLPGLFGPGIKKNVIYDLLEDNNVDRIHADGVFQYYDLRLLWADVQRVMEAEIDVLNIATEPIATAEVARVAFGMPFDTRPEGVSPGHYDMRSVHSSQWGRDDGYLYGRDDVLDRLRRFVAEERRR